MSEFGEAPIKQEGSHVEYDSTCPIFPPETWKDRLRWKAKRFFNRLKYWL